MYWCGRGNDVQFLTYPLLGKSAAHDLYSLPLSPHHKCRGQLLMWRKNVKEIDTSALLNLFCSRIIRLRAHTTETEHSVTTR